MIEVKDKSDLRSALSKVRKDGKSIGLVPTMGFLHDGHLSLVKQSVSECDFSVVSIYVNPAQFGDNKDLDKYPRDNDHDYHLLDNAKTDLIFRPSDNSMYDHNHSTWVSESYVSTHLCGKSRTNHFKGVLTVVAKLFNLTQPDRVYFGQKDYQQAVLICKMVNELDFPLNITICPTVREADGLAMSSRNSYLNPSERQEALIFYNTLQYTRDQIQNGEADVFKLVNKSKEYFQNISTSAKLEYFEIRDADNLAELSSLDSKNAVALIAGRVGFTRLIDNTKLFNVD